MRRTIGGLVTVLILTVITACGAGSSPNQGAQGAAQAGANVSLGTAAAGSGKPLNIFFFNVEGTSATASSPESYEAAEAAVDYINRNLGGIHGRPVALTHCATLGTPDSSTNCANKAVDAKPDVVVKGVDVTSEAAVPIITAAGIPYVTENAGSPAELNTRLSFVLASGYAAQFAPIAPYLQSKGSRSIGVIYTNVSALSTPLDGPVAALFRKYNISYTSAPVAITTGDLTPAYNALLAKHVDAILVVASPAQCAAALKARSSLADSTPLFMSSSCDVSSVLNTVPASVTQGAVFEFLDTSAVPTDMDTRIYLKAMQTYQPEAVTGSFAPSGFSTIMNLYRALMTVPDPSTLNQQTIAATLESARNVPLFMGAGQTFSCGADLVPSAPSVCTGAAFLVSYSSGRYSLINSYDAARLLAGIS